jgi:predicted HAD superfamily Cof-like phosphohydrolase
MKQPSNLPPGVSNADVEETANVQPFDPFQDIIEFHEKFDLAYDGPPRELPPELATLRNTQELEEVTEIHNAPTDADKLDGYVDLFYFCLGTCYLRGWNFREAWRRVHAANMRKKRALPDGSDSKRGSGFDVVKPPGWVAPDLTDLVGENDPEVIARWENLKSAVSICLAEFVLRDKPNAVYASLGAAIRYEFTPILERLDKGERSQSLKDTIEALLKKHRNE